MTQAISSGITTLGFTPHSPVPLQSPCNMPDCDVAAYFSEIDRLRQLYGHSITLLAGMEIDYLGSDWGPCSSYFDSLPLDYRIASVHFIPDFDGNPIDIDGRVTSFNKKWRHIFATTSDMSCRHFSTDRWKWSRPDISTFSDTPTKLPAMHPTSLRV